MTSDGGKRRLVEDMKVLENRIDGPEAPANGWDVWADGEGQTDEEWAAEMEEKRREAVRDSHDEACLCASCERSRRTMTHVLRGDPKEWWDE
jgi:hypothetical protein